MDFTQPVINRLDTDILIIGGGAAGCAAAIEAREAGEEKVILFNLSGHGHFDMSAYDAYYAGKLVDHRPTDEELAAGISVTDGLPKP